MSNSPNGFDWNQMRAFLATVEAGSLSAAARVLRQTQPTLSRQIAALEEELGLLLFERVGRRLVLTDSGRLLVENVREMGAAADRIAIAAASQSQTVEGRVRITASDLVAAFLLPEALSRLYEVAPGIDVEIIADNTINDLMRREADIAIRHVRPEQPDLVARRCPNSRVRFYAASRFFESHERPRNAAELAGLPFIGFAVTDGLVDELNKRGAPVARSNFRWHSTSVVVVRELMRRGLGVSVMFEEVASTMPDLEPVLPEMEPMIAPMWLVTHRELHTSRRIRLVFDVLAQALASRATPANPG